MWIALLAFVRSPLGKWTLIVVGLCALVLGIYAYGHHAGAQAGAQSAKAEQMEVDRKQYEAVVEQHKQFVQDSQQRDAQWSEIAERQATTVTQLQGALKTMEVQRNATQTRIAGMSDPAIFADLITRLAVRAPTDTTTSLHPEELRKMDAIAADYSDLKRELVNVQDTLDATNAKADAIQKRYENCAQANVELTSYSTNLEGYYVRAYNAVPKRRNILLTIVTFGLKGKPKKLSLPSPQEVIAKKLVKAAL